jgi:predicted RND superfamily exporter protein
VLSDTGAIRSFGAAAVLGEVTCISAALVVVPALVLVAALFNSRGSQARPAPAP